MPFIGKQPQAGAYSKLDSITTSATATYNLTLDSGAYYPQSANHLLVSLNGVIQAPQDSFTVSGSQIIFDSALTNADVIDFIIALGDTLDIGVPSAGSVNTSQLANDAVTTAKIAAGQVTSAKLDTNIAITGALTSGAIAASGNISTTSNTISITNSSYPQLQINGSTKNWSLFADAGGPLYIKNATDNSNSVLIHPTGGVSFNGDTAAANVLDDYEEGTWTPIFNQTSRSISSYTSQDGYYRKVGSQVTVWFALRATNSGSGNIGIGGLPFAPATGSPLLGGQVGSARESAVEGASYMMEGITSSGIGVIRRYDNGAFPTGAASIQGFATYYTA